MLMDLVVPIVFSLLPDKRESYKAMLSKGYLGMPKTGAERFSLISYFIFNTQTPRLGPGGEKEEETCWYRPSNIVML